MTSEVPGLIAICLTMSQSTSKAPLETLFFLRGCDVHVSDIHARALSVGGFNFVQQQNALHVDKAGR